MACGGVHNLCLTQSDVPFQHELFKMFKNELFVDIELVLENFIPSNNSGNTISNNDIPNVSIIKAHKFILISRSTYFYNCFVTEKNNKITFKNFDEIVLRNIIDYMYIDDLGFIEEIKSTNLLLDALKLTKMFKLKNVEEKIEFKLKSILSKYSEALQFVDKSEGLNSINVKTNYSYNNPQGPDNTNNISANEVNSDNSNCSNNSNINQNISNTTNVNNNLGVSEILARDFKGLFFLPNGNPIVIFDENLIEKIMKNCILLNVNDSNINKECNNNYRLYTQKNSQQNSNYENSSFNTKNSLKIKINNPTNNTSVNNLLQSNPNIPSNNNTVTSSSSINKKNNNQLKESIENSEININNEINESNMLNIDESKSKTKNYQIFNDYNKGNLCLKEILKMNGLLPIDQNELPEFLKYFNDKDSSDVTLKVDNYEFYCHKVNLLIF